MHVFETKRRMPFSRGGSDLFAPRTRKEPNVSNAPWPEVKRGNEAGERMPADVQHKMERGFGFDFSDIRIHQDDKAESIGALAFAQGTHLHFAPGQYSPRSSRGQGVLGHELAHVVQQASGRVSAPVQALGGAINDDPRLEQEADKMGERAAKGHSVDKAEESPADEPLQSRLERVRVGKAAKQPIQRKVEVPAGTTLPSFDKYLSKSGDTYSYGDADRTPGKLSFEIFTSLFNSPRVFKLQGDTGPEAEHFLMRHLDAREGVVNFANNKQYKFEGGRENFHMNPAYWEWNKEKGTFRAKDKDKQVEASKDLNVHPEQYAIGCAAATRLTVEGGGDSPRLLGDAEDHDWVPGESGWIKNEGWSSNQRPGLEGENIIYMGGKQFWGHFSDVKAVKTYQEWFAQVQSWDQAAKLQPGREWPSKGLRSK